MFEVESLLEVRERKRPSIEPTDDQTTKTPHTEHPRRADLLDAKLVTEDLKNVVILSICRYAFFRRDLRSCCSAIIIPKYAYSFGAAPALAGESRASGGEEAPVLGTPPGPLRPGELCRRGL